MPTAQRRRIELELRSYDALVRHEVGRLVRRLPPNVLADDLYSAARLGLWQLLQRTHVRHTSHIVMRIRGAMFDELRSQDWLTRRLREDNKDAKMISTEAIHEWMRAQVTDTGVHAAMEARLTLRPLLELLEPRDREVLVTLYLDEVSAQELARRLGVSEPRVAQLRDRALVRLRVLAERDLAAMDSKGLG
jgi:RNA polymerase sigma factor FliA